MRNKKKRILTITALGLAFIIVASIFHSKQEPVVPIVSHIKEGTITGKHFLGATAVYLSSIPATGKSIHSLINALFTVSDDNTIVINDGQPKIPPADGDDFDLYVANAAGIVSMPFEVHFPPIDNISLYGTTTPDLYDISLYGTATSTIPGMSDTDSDILLEYDNNVPTYADFLTNDLQNACPFYRPNGVAYRECLTNLLEVREAAVTKTYNDLVNNIRIINDEVMAEDPTDGDTYTATPKAFLTNLIGLQEAWKHYRDALCDAELAGTMDGSNEEGYINACKLYETTAQEDRLTMFWYYWISLPVATSREQNTTPKLESFKELMAREQALLLEN